MKTVKVGQYNVTHHIPAFENREEREKILKEVSRKLTRDFITRSHQEQTKPAVK